MSTIENLQEKYGRMLLSQKETARELGVSTKSVERLRNDGKLPFRMILGAIKIHVKDLAVLIG